MADFVTRIAKYYLKSGDYQIVSAIIILLTSLDRDELCKGVPDKDHVLRVYADVLGRWGKIRGRCEVSRRIKGGAVKGGEKVRAEKARVAADSDAMSNITNISTFSTRFACRSQHEGLEIAYLCGRCGRGCGEDGNFCRRCGDFVFRCGVCGVRGGRMAVVCMGCGHGGCLECYEDWFSEEVRSERREERVDEAL